MSIAEFLTRLHRDERGLAAVEYGLLCGLIVLVMIAALNGVANTIVQTWNNVDTQAQVAVQQATAS
ncbi:Flp family type IVb pilin [Novosphingobium humi]|uniref:Flp family type IVb pilin n=1 Tax=Novosphingobium humi TaxID=2282397 RepID=A0ABY7TWE6_9SPHN|nr:Flp family type IVb pilin [Novosphingobium humi]WCT76675.1 Flp family type IVb pilin [Novosphingobium humi]WJS99810.1 Flp family type IVb pilin [Novosphingobium humi]